MYAHKIYEQYRLNPVTEQTLSDIDEQTRSEARASGRGFRIALTVFGVGATGSVAVGQTGIAMICAVAFFLSAIVWREDFKAHAETTKVSLYRARADELPSELLEACKTNTILRDEIAGLLSTQGGVLYQFQVAGAIREESKRNHSNLTKELFGGVV